MLLLCLAAFFNTLFRFAEIGERDRAIFSAEQNKSRHDKKEEALQEALKESMGIGPNDLEILRTLKPNSSHLGLILLQKAIFDILYGIFFATAGASMYTAYDILISSTISSDYMMLGNAKLALIIYATG